MQQTPLPPWYDIDVDDYPGSYVQTADGKSVLSTSRWPKCNWDGAVAIKQVSRTSRFTGRRYTDYACDNCATLWAAEAARQGTPHHTTE